MLVVQRGQRSLVASRDAPDATYLIEPFRHAGSVALNIDHGLHGLNGDHPDQIG